MTQELQIYDGEEERVVALRDEEEHWATFHAAWIQEQQSQQDEPEES